MSRAVGAGAPSAGLPVGRSVERSVPVGRVEVSLRTAAIMFFTAVYDTARLAPSVDTNRLQASSRIGLLACLPMLSEGVRKFVCEALI